MRPTSCFVILAALAACGGGGPGTGPDASGGDDGGGDDAPLGPDDGAASGTRLKLRWSDFAGTRIGGILAHDTELGADCRPQVWDDGTVRCTPDGYGIGYRDAACTEPVGTHYVSETCPQPAPEFFTDRRYTACDGTTAHVYTRGALVPDPAGFYEKNGDLCAGPYPTDRVELFTLGPELARTALATLTPAQPGPEARYRQQFWASADGARLFADVVDTELATTCWVQRFPGEPTGVCAPGDLAYAHHFAEATCDTPVGTAAAECDAPAYVASFERGVCDTRVQFHYYPAEAAPAALYAAVGDACEPAIAAPGYAYVTAGPELVLPELTYTIGDAGDRQVEIPYLVDGASRLRGWGGHDAVNGVECMIVDAGSGLRCLPVGATANPIYTDATCTTSIDVVELSHPDPTCEVPAPPRFATRYTDSCTEPYAVHAVGAEYTGPTYQPDGVGCVEVVAPDRIRYRVGAELPLSQFATGTVIVDP